MSQSRSRLIRPLRFTRRLGRTPYVSPKDYFPTDVTVGFRLLPQPVLSPLEAHPCRSRLCSLISPVAEGVPTRHSPLITVTYSDLSSNLDK